jgi:type IV pilus assembly protein PilV
MSTKIQRLAGKLQSGFALVEVLVSLFILAIGMLGIAAMTLVSAKSNSSSYLKQQAVQSAYDIVDRMHANRSQAVAGAYGGAPNASAVDCYVSSCTPDQITAYDLSFWYLNDLSQLPSGTGSITIAPSGTSLLVTVTVQWDDGPTQSKLGAIGATAAASPNLAQLSIQTLL